MASRISWAKSRFSAWQLRAGLNWWPPLGWGPGIRVDKIAPDFMYARVSLPQRFYNSNYFGTHFGGSLYSMVDPMYTLMLIHVLGSEYIGWDKAASIEYVKPGKGTVTAEFRLQDDLVSSLRQMQPGEKRVFDLNVDVTDQVGDVVARVVKTQYVRRKNPKMQSNL